MDKGKLNLLMTFHVYTDGAPVDTEVEDVVVLSIPRLNSKYVQFPKVIEGVTERIVEVHNQKVSAWEIQKAKEEAERKRRPHLWDVTPDEAREADALYREGVAIMDAMANAPTEAEPVRPATAEERGTAFPVIDGRALIKATDEQIAAAVALATAEADKEA